MPAKIEKKPYIRMGWKEAYCRVYLPNWARPTTKLMSTPRISPATEPTTPSRDDSIRKKFEHGAILGAEAFHGPNLPEPLGDGHEHGVGDTHGAGHQRHVHEPAIHDVAGASGFHIHAGLAQEGVDPRLVFGGDRQVAHQFAHDATV